MRGSAKFDELQEFFERTVNKIDGVYLGCNPRERREQCKPDGTWPRTFYGHGMTDSLFRVFLSGYQYAQAENNLQKASS
jgi:hypothetical protein